ncbi:Myotubularin- protein 14 [Nowakowskiella sp. JEL0078]|nr:Myotubularin- protein 14 [Nowakowskiella sp. JEL0078]
MDSSSGNKGVEKHRQADIELLKKLRVKYINDLMMENRKVKYGLTVSSSEKADSSNRYSEFSLLALPYPGVEFFKNFKDNGHCAKKLFFDWTQTFADANLNLPVADLPGDVLKSARWDSYKSWDLRWDRTPLFISLIRMSLWADGEIHTSLTAAEMLYFTIAYDWLLFSHLLADRNSRGEDIFQFCFYFLKFIMEDEFSLKQTDLENKQQEGSEVLNNMKNKQKQEDLDVPQAGSWQMVSLATTPDNSLLHQKHQRNIFGSSGESLSRVEGDNISEGFPGIDSEGPRSYQSGIFQRTSIAPKPIVRAMGSFGSWSRAGEPQNTSNISGEHIQVFSNTPKPPTISLSPHSKLSLNSTSPSSNSSTKFSIDGTHTRRRTFSVPESPTSLSPESAIFDDDDFFAGTSPHIFQHQKISGSSFSQLSSIKKGSTSDRKIKTQYSLLSLKSSSSVSSFTSISPFPESAKVSTTSINQDSELNKDQNTYQMSKCKCCADTIISNNLLFTKDNVSANTHGIFVEDEENSRRTARKTRLRALRYLFYQIQNEQGITGIIQKPLESLINPANHSIDTSTPPLPLSTGFWNNIWPPLTSNSTLLTPIQNESKDILKTGLTRRYSSPALDVSVLSESASVTVCSTKRSQTPPADNSTQDNHEDYISSRDLVVLPNNQLPQRQDMPKQESTPALVLAGSTYRQHRTAQLTRTNITSNFGSKSIGNSKRQQSPDQADNWSENTTSRPSSSRVGSSGGTLRDWVPTIFAPSGVLKVFPLPFKNSDLSQNRGGRQMAIDIDFLRFFSLVYVVFTISFILWAKSY